jgi:hypothetical protein
MQSFSCNLAFGNLRKTITCHKIPVISIFQVDALVQHYFQHYFIRFLFLKCFSVLPWNYANLSKIIGRRIQILHVDVLIGHVFSETVMQ